MKSVQFLSSSQRLLSVESVDLDLDGKMLTLTSVSLLSHSPPALSAAEEKSGATCGARHHAAWVLTSHTSWPEFLLSSLMNYPLFFSNLRIFNRKALLDMQSQQHGQHTHSSLKFDFINKKCADVFIRICVHAIAFNPESLMSTVLLRRSWDCTHVNTTGGKTWLKDLRHKPSSNTAEPALTPSTLWCDKSGADSECCME